MSTINTNITALEKKIDKLSLLKTDCEAINAKANELVGSGISIEVVHAIDMEYEAIKTAVVTLLDNSVAFFTNVKSSLVEADKKAADNLK